MNTKIVILFFSLLTLVFGLNPKEKKPQQKEKNKETTKEKTTTAADNKDKTKTVAVAKIDTVKTKETVTVLPSDTLQVDPNSKFKFYKKGAHASYYHNKFNGKRTASGTRFDNNKYTAAHKKLPFGTIVRVTNEANGKSVIVEITDRGPFSKVREIDLSRRAFMDIASNKNSGALIVKLEVIEN